MQKNLVEIRVQGRLGEQMHVWFGELSLAYEDGSDGCPPDGRVCTVLQGYLDPAGLRGVLDAIFDLGLQLVSVNRLEDPRRNEPGSPAA